MIRRRKEKIVSVDLKITAADESRVLQIGILIGEFLGQLKERNIPYTGLIGVNGDYFFEEYDEEEEPEEPEHPDAPSPEMPEIW